LEEIDEKGWLSNITCHPSPNFDQRPNPDDVDLLVIHNISLPPEQFGGPWISDFFCNQLDREQHPYFNEIADLKVSSHLLIRRDGQPIQFVSFLDRAWHAGTSCFQGREKCNDFSIGIELEGSDNQPFTEQQYQSLASITKKLMAYFPAITPERITGHSDIAPGRKTDPGPCFDWPHFKKLINQSQA
jgi:AmpD protein